MQAIYTMYIIPLFDSFKQVCTVCVLCTYICIAHGPPRPLMQINILLLVLYVGRKCSLFPEHLISLPLGSS